MTFFLILAPLAAKEEVIAAVRAKGFSPVDDNDADALALLDWAIANRFGGGDRCVMLPI